MISIEEALQLIASSVQPVGTENVRMTAAPGRILAEPVFADVDSPPHTKSVMDGFAVRSQDVRQDCRLRILETIVAGDNPKKPVMAGTASRIMTGAPLPDGADSVVMIEQTREFEQDGCCYVSLEIDSLDPGRHTMQRAASFSAGESILAVQHRIRPMDIGLMAEVGATEVKVYRQPSAAVLPTGNELVDATLVPAAGQIRNSNGPMLESMLKNSGLLTSNLEIGRDDPLDLSRRIAIGLQSDLLVLSGGVSAGMLDLVPGLLQQAGVEEVFHKVHVKPGKPIWFGVHGQGSEKKYVFGLPGNPVSSLVGFELFVRAAIRRMNGFENIHPETVRAELTHAHRARGDRPTWWPGRWIGSQLPIRSVKPLRWLGSSDLRPLALADVLIYFPGESEDFEAGQTVDVVPIG